jgi:hypothetical protein
MTATHGVFDPYAADRSERLNHPKLRTPPQKYGTQYVSDGFRQRLWDVLPETTDQERVEWDVPPPAEQLRKAEEATLRDPGQPKITQDAPQWLKDALQRWGVPLSG